MRLEVSEVVDRPVATVFRFYAYDHVRNHPRWDPDMELGKVSDGPIGVGPSFAAGTPTSTLLWKGRWRSSSSKKTGRWAS